jgi:hypothetical protein
MGRVPPHPCSSCGNWVLGLLGQDAFLPEYAAGSQLEEMRESGAPLGWVHAQCLFESGWAPRWTALLTAIRTQLPGTTPLYEADSLVILEHEATGDRIVISCGTEVRVSERQVKLAKAQQSFISIPIEHEFNLDLRRHQRIAERIAGTFKSGATMQVLELVDAFSVRSRLINPAALTDGWLCPIPTDPTTTLGELKHHSLCAWARYHLLVNAAAAKALHVS